MGYFHGLLHSELITFCVIYTAVTDNTWLQELFVTMDVRRMNAVGATNPLFQWMHEERGWSNEPFVPMDA
jgi:hypothetical protein